MERNDQILFFALLAGIVAVILAAAAGSSVSGAIAGWLGALGGLFTVIGAVVISRRDGQERKAESAKREAQRAAAFAIQILPFVMQVQNSLERICLANADDQFGLTLARENPLSAVNLFSVDPLTDRSILRDLSALPVSTIRRVMLLITGVDAYTQYIQSWMPTGGAMTDQDRLNYRSDMRRRITLLQATVLVLRDDLDTIASAADGTLR